jgi:hypothetical protein
MKNNKASLERDALSNKARERGEAAQRRRRRPTAARPARPTSAVAGGDDLRAEDHVVAEGVPSLGRKSQPVSERA